MNKCHCSILLFFLAIFPTLLNAQSGSGFVFDLETRRPIENASIKAGKQSLRTAANGHYTIAGLKYGDTITVSHISYKSYSFIFHSNILETVFLEKRVRELSSVIVFDQPGDYDSLLFRREFSSIFNYKQTGLKELFIPKPLYPRPGEIIRQPSYNTLFTINLLQLPAFLRGSNNSKSKLQKSLLKDETDSYLNRAIFRKRSAELTLLKGDTLQQFIDDYTLPVYVIREMTEYEIMDYIMRSYEKFGRIKRKED